MDSHSPLSASLQKIIEHPSARRDLTLNSLIQKTEGRGLFLVMILVCLPFVVPVSVPGASLLMGSVVMLISLRMAAALPPRLPGFVGERALPHERFEKVLRASIRVLRFMEKLVRPRRSVWMTWRITRIGNALLIAFMGFLMALPLPPIPPFTNSLPSYAIILLALSMMEEDGVMVWAGYAASLTTIAYFAILADVISTNLHKVFHFLA